jgi:hypothetical protein
VTIATLLDDIGQPYTCESWSNLGSITNNFILDDGIQNYDYASTYATSSYFYPTVILIDHNMTIYYRNMNLGSSYANLLIEEMLFNCGEFCDIVIGDLNQDNTLDILDIIITVNLVMNNEYLYYADINEDSIVNILDIIQMVNNIL